MYVYICIERERDMYQTRRTCSSKHAGPVHGAVPLKNNTKTGGKTRRIRPSCRAAQNITTKSDKRQSNMYICMYVLMYVSLSLSLSLYIYIYIYIYTCIVVCVYVYMYIYIYIHNGKRQSTQDLSIMPDSIFDEGAASARASAPGARPYSTIIYYTIL